jgi:hypothetical protein
MAEDPASPFTRRNAKVALFATALLWLLAWTVAAWRARTDPPPFATDALVVVAYGAFGLLSFGAPRLRWVATIGALCLALAVASATSVDARLLAGGLAVAGAASIDPAPPSG